MDPSEECRAVSKLGKRLQHTARDKTSDEKQQTGPWRPLKRLTRYEMEHMRSLRAMQPEEWTYDKLSKAFGVSFSAVKRILRSKFDPSPEVREMQDKQVQEMRSKRKRRILNNVLNAKQKPSN